jgi:hypothetical protein
VQVFTDRAAFEAAVAARGYRQFNETFDGLVERVVASEIRFLEGTGGEFELTLPTSGPSGYFEISDGRIDHTASVSSVLGRFTIVPKSTRVYGVGAELANTSLRSLEPVAGPVSIAGRNAFLRVEAPAAFTFVGLLSDQDLGRITLSVDSRLFAALDRVTLATPIPAALPLLATALGGLAIVWRRRRG